MRAKLETTINAMNKMNARAAAGEAYDQQIAEGNTEGTAGVQTAIDALIDQTRSIERVIATLDLGAIELEGSDSLDNPDAVFQYLHSIIDRNFWMGEQPPIQLFSAIGTADLDKGLLTRYFKFRNQNDNKKRQTPDRTHEISERPFGEFRNFADDSDIV